MGGPGVLALGALGAAPAPLGAGLPWWADGSGVGRDVGQKDDVVASAKAVITTDLVLASSCRPFQTLFENALTLIQRFAGVVWKFFDILDAEGMPEYWPAYNWMFPFLRGWNSLRARCPECTGDLLAHSVVAWNQMAFCQSYLGPLEDARVAAAAIGGTDGERKCLSLDLAAVILHEMWHRAAYALSFREASSAGIVDPVAAVLGVHRSLQQLPDNPGEAQATTFEWFFRYMVMHQERAANGQLIETNATCCKADGFGADPRDWFLDPAVGFNTPPSELRAAGFARVAPQCR